VQFTVSEFVTWLGTQTVSRTITHIQQHHTDVPGYQHFTGNNYFALQAWMAKDHVELKKWPDIGQHFSIFPDGTVVTGRSLDADPTCISKANSGGICIENVGNFDVGGDKMTLSHRQATLRVTAALLIRFPGIPRNDRGIVYHHWFNKAGARTTGTDAVKSCPGSAFFGGNTVEAFNANFLPAVLALIPVAVHARPGPGLTA